MKVRDSLDAWKRQTMRTRPSSSRTPNVPSGPPGSSSVGAPGRNACPRSETPSTCTRSPVAQRDLPKPVREAEVPEGDRDVFLDGQRAVRPGRSRGRPPRRDRRTARAPSGRSRARRAAATAAMSSRRISVAKSTRGGSRCASSSTSKNSRDVNPNGPGEHRAGERLDRVVVRQDRVVVDLPRDGDPVLRLGELRLELAEVLVRLELRIRLGDGEQPAERLAEDALGLRRLGGRLRLLCARARCRDLLEGPALVRRVALDRLDEVRDEIPPALELDLDLRPRVVDAVPVADEPVVERDREDDQEQDDHDQDDQPDHGRDSTKPGSDRRRSCPPRRRTDDASNQP